MSSPKDDNIIVDESDFQNVDDIAEEDKLTTQEFVEDIALEEEPEPELERPITEGPEDLPILPLRGLVVFPDTAMPLTIGQPRSLKLVDHISNADGMVGLFSTKDPDLELPEPDDIYRVGTLAQVHRPFRAPDGTVRLLVQGLSRIRIEEYVATEPFLRARVAYDPEELEESLEVEALMRNVVDQFGRMADLVPNFPGDLISSALNMDDPLQLVYSVTSYVRIDLDEQQEILELPTIIDKLHRLMQLLNKELEVLELGKKIQTDAQSEMEKVQREYYLREQLKAIQKELGEVDDHTAEIEEFREKIAAAGMTEEAESEAQRELDRLSRLPTAVAEYGVIRTYLDWLVELPWIKHTDDDLDINHAREVLDEDHYGLQDIKDRIIEFLAVRKLRLERAEALQELEGDDLIRHTREGVILCFVGPPGVGKTSLGASIARTMGRKFIRLSLGGVRDEAEIRGFRRTYVGAMPGRLIQALRRAQTRNPIIMLDEVDKLGHDFRGDPAAALLEVLDPEQNSEFRDHYLDVAFDLSEVMFITTANELDPIPSPLRDRMEIIHLSGYTEQEKVEIARHYLVPRQIRENGVLPDEIAFDEDAILKLVNDYTREAGVRNLEREIGKVVRKVATRIVGGDDESFQVTADLVTELLKHPRIGYRSDVIDRTDRPGVAIGLAWTPMGGDVLFVEAAQMAGKQGLTLTGSLGDVMQESARAAFSYVRARADELGISEDFFEKHDFHLHVPAGSIPKDGPSAGVTITTALVSLLTQRAVFNNVAMTGEITLRGKVLPVGGIKDKVLAADRFGLETVILPKRNEPDLDELTDEVRDKMKFILVDSVDDVLNAALIAEAPSIT